MVATDDTAMSSSEVNGSDETLFPNAEFLEFILSPHRPLGCTVEESLADTRHIFVTKVTGEGYAEQAGLLPGDVIVGVSDLFGILAPATGLGIDKV
jgi:S1-C subfamily serine protease